MRILAFDTSSAISAVAVCDGDRVLAQDDSPAEDGGKHGEVLLPRIEAVLAAAGLRLQQLELIAVGVGPGSFTGLRVGLATAKGLALATGIALRGVGSLQVMAAGALAREQAARALAVLDAGKGELFAAAFARVAGAQPLQPLLAPQRMLPQALAQRVAALAAAGEPLWLCGGGARRGFEQLAAVLGPGARLVEPALDLPQGRHVASEAWREWQAQGASDVAALEPVYLRGSDAKLPDEPLSLG